MAIQHKETIPDNIEVRGARVNNLKNVNVDIPLNAFVAITGKYRVLGSPRWRWGYYTRRGPGTI